MQQKSLLPGTIGLPRIIEKIRFFLLFLIVSGLGSFPLQGKTIRFHEPQKPSQFLSKSPYDQALRAYEEGYTHYRWGRFSQAEAKLKEALSLEPNLIKAHYWLGKVYKEMGALKDAIFYEEEVLRISRLIRERRNALTIENNEYPALSQIQKLKEQEKNAAEAFERGRHFLQEGHWDAAVAEFKAAAIYYPGNTEYLMQISRILWDRKDFQGSAKYYSDFLERQPNSEKEILEAIDRLIASGNTLRAQIYLQRFSKRFPENEKYKILLKEIEPNESHDAVTMGKIVEKTHGQVILDFGLEDGLKLADEYTLGLRTFRPGNAIKDSETGKAIGRFPDEISGHLLVTKVFAKSCWAIVQEEYGQGVKAGDLVEIKTLARR